MATVQIRRSAVGHQARFKRQKGGYYVYVDMLESSVLSICITRAPVPIRDEKPLILGVERARIIDDLRASSIEAWLEGVLDFYKFWSGC